MKKNKMLRMASVLLILVLLTTSVIGSTFAKYTTTANSSDTARVAKWGVEFSARSGLFAQTYKDNKVDADSPTATVKVGTTDIKNLVAPGTNGTGLGVQTTGTPEVSYKVTIKLADDATMPTLTYTPSAAGSTAQTYEPVTFSVYNGTTPLKEGMDLDDLKGLFNGTKVIYEYDIAANKYYVDTNGSGTIEANEKGDGNGQAAAPNIQIKWEWTIEHGTSDEEKTLYNTLDTILGNAAVDSTNKTHNGITATTVNTAVSLNWTVTATQID